MNTCGMPLFKLLTPVYASCSIVYISLPRFLLFNMTITVTHSAQTIARLLLSHCPVLSCHYIAVVQLSCHYIALKQHNSHA